MRKILIICGPTATGKTDIGIKLSQKFNGEIVSADSRQVYREMDILTGKDIPRNSKFEIRNSKLRITKNIFTVGFKLKENIPVWLLDIVPPNYEFNVSDYFSLAKSVINNIWERDKLPVVIGGSGYYINSLLKTYETVKIPRNDILRKELYLFDTYKLQERLKTLDRNKIDSMNNSDINNPRRLIRAIEVAVWKNNHQAFENTSIPLESDSIIIGLTAPKEIIQKNIEARVNKRIEEGAIQEVKKVMGRYKNTGMIAKASLGFKELMEYIMGKYTLHEAGNLWIRREFQYAKRQLVWFNKMKEINWYNLNETDFGFQIEEKVRKWYTQK
jgi:tRNA dimethylallyltransferase